MCCANCGDVSFADLLRDPLIQLVMRSDGVTERDMIALRDQVCRSRANARSAGAAPAGGFTCDLT
jgi:hypothetical protein